MKCGCIEVYVWRCAAAVETTGLVVFAYRLSLSLPLSLSLSLPAVGLAAAVL